MPLLPIYKVKEQKDPVQDLLLNNSGLIWVWMRWSLSRLSSRAKSRSDAASDTMVQAALLGGAQEAEFCNEGEAFLSPPLGLFNVFHYLICEPMSKKISVL